MPKKYVYWLLLVCLIVFVSNLNIVYVNIMEARNFITAREMLTHGHWLHTTLNLEPRYQKPPLPTWLTALAMLIFGKSNLYALRLPAVIAVIVLIFSSFKLVYLITKNHYQAFISSLILATSFYIIFSGRDGQWDIFAHSFMMLALVALFQSLNANKIHYKNWLLSGFFVGLSILSKGPVSLYVLFLSFIIAYAVIYKFKDFKKHLKPASSALILALIVGTWWAIYIYFTDAEAVKAIATKETLAWSNHNVRPWYYYWSFFTQSGMWTFFAFIGLLYPFMKKRVANLKAYQFSLLWTLTAVILLSLVPEKKARYVLPVLIPLAFNTSFYINYLISKTKTLSKSDVLISNFGFGLLALICFAVPVLGFISYQPIVTNYPIHFWLTAIALWIIGIWFIRSLIQKNLKRPFYLSIAMMCSLMFFGLPLLKGFYNNPQFTNLNHFKQVNNFSAIPIFIKGYVAPELLWEYGQAIPSLKPHSEIKFLKKFGIISQDNPSETILKGFKITLKEQIDLNYIISKSGHRNNRLLTNFYLLEKKQDSTGY